MQALLIDLDDTLADDRAATAAAFAAFLRAHPRLQAASDAAELLERWHAVALRHWTRFEQGEVSFQGQRRARVREFLGMSLSDSEADDAFAPYWRAYEAGWRLFDDVPAFLERAAGIPKVIVTNGERPQRMQKIVATGLLPHVVAVITPTDCGRWKPHADMFAAALRAAGVPASGCMMIGDSLRNDIEPARALGMACFHVDRAQGRGLDGLLLGAR